MRYLLILFVLIFTSACGQKSETAKPADSVQARVVALNNTAIAHHKNNNKEKALHYHNQALQLAKKHGLHEHQIRSLIGIAHVLKADDADQSVLHLKKALHLADSIGHQQLSAEIYRSLSEIYRQQSNYKQALQALEEHHRIADQMMLRNQQQQIALVKRTYQRDTAVLIAVPILLILLIVAYYLRKTRTLNARLHAANQIKDKLFTIIGHDLRNPIGNITSVLSLMEHDILTADEQREMISQMRKQGDISLEILNSLLSWGKAQLSGVIVNPVNFSAADVVKNNIAALQGKANEKDLEIDNQVGQGIELKADRDHFDFIIRNLLSNAIKFSHDKGKIVIAATIKGPAKEVVFSVTDNGIGISSAQQKAFLSKELEISFGTKGEKGTGIGLMLSKEFIQANGGTIWLESMEGKGTTFYFSYGDV